MQFDRRRRLERDSRGVTGKFGVEPGSIPDYLALVGDTAEGYPGLPGWGEKSAAAVLSRFGHLEAIPANARDWHIDVSNPQSLSQTLNERRERAFLFRDIATLRTDLPLFASVDDLLWQGPTPAFAPTAERLDKAQFAKKRCVAVQYGGTLRKENDCVPRQLREPGLLTRMRLSVTNR